MLTIKISYKASHRVEKFDDAIHSSTHFHMWTVTATIDTTHKTPDAHDIQKTLYGLAPHFGDHGYRDVEDVARWWFEAINLIIPSGCILTKVETQRDDGIGAIT